MFTTRGWRRPLITAALVASFLLSVVATAALAAPASATDWFSGAAVIPAGASSPVQIDPKNLTVRSDGAIGLGYTYQAKGTALGQEAGSFTYLEHGYLYFKNPLDPTSLAGSSFTSGVYTLKPDSHGAPITIADTSPGTYKSGVETIKSGIDSVVDKAAPRVRGDLRELLGTNGSLTYGYFTFTDKYGTFTGYATPDFNHFIIQITF